MPGFLKNAPVYLGLGPDDEYDDYEESDDRPEPPARESRDLRDVSAAPRPSPVASRPAPPAGATSVRTSTRTAPPPRPARESVRARLASEAGSGVMTDGSVVRTLPPKDRQVKERPRMDAVSTASKTKSAGRGSSANAPVVVAPSSFNGAQEVADKFKASQAVILNLQGADKELSRRLLDFCSGICYALGGNMEKVASRVYLLTPVDVEVSEDERRRLRERGLTG